MMRDIICAFTVGLIAVRGAAAQAAPAPAPLPIVDLGLTINQATLNVRKSYIKGMKSH